MNKIAAQTWLLSLGTIGGPAITLSKLLSPQLNRRRSTGNLHPLPTCFAFLAGRRSTFRIQCRHASSKPSKSLSPLPPSSASATRTLPLGRPLDPFKGSTKKPALTSRFRDFERQISAAGGSVQLFEAPLQRSYFASCYAVASFAWFWTAYNAYDVFMNPLSPISYWVKVMSGGAELTAFGLGVVALWRAQGVVSSIIADQVNGRTRLRIKVHRMIPFTGQREIVANLEDLWLKGQLADPEARRNISVLLQPQRQLAATPFWKAPRKKTSLFFWSIFSNIQRVFSMGSFSYLSVQRDGRDVELRLDELGVTTAEFGTLCRYISSTE